jgi:hypothetical protein
MVNFAPIPEEIITVIKTTAKLNKMITKYGTVPVLSAKIEI